MQERTPARGPFDLGGFDRWFSAKRLKHAPPPRGMPLSGGGGRCRTSGPRRVLGVTGPTFWVRHQAQQQPSGIADPRDGVV